MRFGGHANGWLLGGTAAALVAVVGRVPAQEPGTGAGATPCYRFLFGSWNPPLDWGAAGHARSGLTPPAMDQRRADRSMPGERDNASWETVTGDSTLLLFPAWWPVGVLIRFDRRGAKGDTLAGNATALVADASQPRPVTTVRVVPFTCGDPPSHAHSLPLS